MEEPEEWRSVLTGHYEVSSLGRVRRVAPHHGPLVIKKLRPNKYGYPIVTLCCWGKPKTYSVHTLVALAFIGPKPSEEMEVNHLNGIKSDNRYGNLEWCTRERQKAHAVAYDLVAFGDRHGRVKLTRDSVLEIRRLRRPGPHRVTVNSLAKRFGVGRSAIKRAASGEHHRRVKDDVA
jgi:hypothetical protein